MPHSRMFSVHAAVVSGLVSSTVLAVGPEVPCSSDLNCDAAVNGVDLGVLLASWSLPGSPACGGPEACPADFNGDRMVDGIDLSVMLASWGVCQFQHFNPRNPEADALVLELLGADGPLISPQELYERVDRDMGLVRAVMPAMTLVTHYRAWATSWLLIELPMPGDPGDGDDGPSLQCLLDFYQSRACS